LDGGRLTLHTAAPHDVGAWGLWLDAPDDESDLPEATDRLRRGIADGAALVAAVGGAPLTRRLLTEEARLAHSTVSLLMADDAEPPGADRGAGPNAAARQDWALTMVLSGRADLVGIPDAVATSGG